MRISVHNWLLLGALSLLWGGAFFFVAIAVREVSPLSVVFLRVAIAALCLFVVLRAQRARIAVARSVLLAFLVMGFFNNVIPFSLLFWAQTSISSGLASILNATTPIFSILIAHLCLRDEPLHANKPLGVLLGVFGVSVLVGGDLLDGFDVASLGSLACLGAALSYGVAGVYGRRFSRMGITSKHVAFGQLLASSVLMLPVVIIIDQPWNAALPSAAAVASIVALAVASTAAAYVIYFHLIATAGAVNAALVTLLIPPIAIFFGTTFLDEQLQVHHITGMLLVGGALLCIDGRVLRWVFRRPPRSER